MNKKKIIKQLQDIIKQLDKNYANHNHDCYDCYGCCGCCPEYSELNDIVQYQLKDIISELEK